MTDIKENLKKVQERVISAALEAGRDPKGIRVMAVTKKHALEAIRTAMAAGHTDFGENFLQEALPKIKEIGPGPCWHFIGRLQSNKTKPVAQNFQWAHTVDRWRIAQRLSDQRPDHLPPLNVCVQVNVGGEDTKGGIQPKELAALLDKIARLPRIQLRGLMCIPPHSDDSNTQRGYFALLKNLAQSVHNPPSTWDTLSMGMSSDLESAVLEGATIVRIGTAIFGPRVERVTL